MFRSNCSARLGSARLGLALGLLVVGAWALAATPAAANTVRIALLPLVVHSSDSPVYLREGLADMLSARLQQVEGLQVVRVDEASSVTNRVERAVALARPMNVDFVLFGAFTRFGEGASLDVQCASTGADSQSEPLREIFVHSGHIGDVIPDLDELVGKITRFVVRDFESRQLEAPNLARTPEAQSRLALEALRRRVDQLETEMTALRDSRIAPLEVPAGPSPAPDIPPPGPGPGLDPGTEVP
jgi:TolB-like protein